MSLLFSALYAECPYHVALYMLSGGARADIAAAVVVVVCGIVAYIIHPELRALLDLLGCGSSGTCTRPRMFVVI